MKSFNSRLAGLACAVFFVVGASSANAVPLLGTVDGWKPPGGVDYSATGHPSDTGGQDRTYFNFDTGAYDQLWWGPNPIFMGTDGHLNPLGFVGISGDGKTATWSLANIPITLCTPGCGSTYLGSFTGTFEATITNGGTWIDPSTVSIPGTGPDAVTEITSDPFEVNVAFLVGAQAFNAWYFAQQTPPSGTTNISLGGEFWYTTPVPAALPLFAGGLGVMGLLGWRRKKRTAKGAA